MLPKNWPKNIKYTNEVIIKDIQDPPKSFLDGVIIQEITNPDHILFGEYGLLSRRRWEPFEVIGEYCGVLCDGYSDSKYIATLHRDVSDEEALAIDAQYYGNETRFINDYRNISDKPNTQLVSCNIEGHQKILIVVTEVINPYTEILLDYGDDYWEFFKTLRISKQD